MVINEDDYLAHYGRKGMKWYQHIYGEETPVNRKGYRYAKKAAKISKYAAKRDKAFKKGKKYKIFFSNTRYKMATAKAARMITKISRKGYKMTKNDLGRQALDAVLKADGGYKYVDYIRNRNMYEDVMRKVKR